MDKLIEKYINEGKEINAAKLVRSMTQISRHLQDCIKESGNTHFKKEFLKMAKIFKNISDELDGILDDHDAPSYLRVGGNSKQKYKDELQAVHDYQDYLSGKKKKQ